MYFLLVISGQAKNISNFINFHIQNDCKLINTECILVIFIIIQLTDCTFKLFYSGNQTVISKLHLCLLFNHLKNTFSHLCKKPFFITKFFTGIVQRLDQAQICLLDQICKKDFFCIHICCKLCRCFHVIRSKCLYC